MTVVINGTTGYSGPVGTIGDLTTTGNTTLGDASGDTLTINGSTTTLTQGTANGVAYLNGSKVLTSGSALTFDGSIVSNTGVGFNVNNANALYRFQNGSGTRTGYIQVRSDAFEVWSDQAAVPMVFGVANSEAMRLDSAGNLFLGATTSGFAEKFRVYGNYSVFDNGTFTGFVGSGSSLGTGISSDFAIRSSNALAFLTGGATERARIDSSGNLGLGVTPSAWSGRATFQFGTGTTYGNGALSGIQNDTILSTNAYYDGSWKYQASGANLPATIYSQTNGQHQWFTASSGTAGNAISWTQAMTLDASGNLGVGTTSPSVKLTVVGNIKAGYEAATGIVFGLAPSGVPSSNVNCYVLWGDNATFGGENGDLIYIPRTSTTASHRFYTGYGTPAERARITSAGDLLVGTTSSGAIGWSLVNSSNHPYVVSNTDLSGRVHYYFQYNGSSVGLIETSTTSTSYITSSDYRLKNTIAPMTGALAKVALLKPCTYKWNTDDSDGEGFIAHELAEVCPQAVSGEKDAVDADGNPVYQGIDTSFLVATLTAAIQEQQAIIEQLKARLDAANL